MAEDFVAKVGIELEADKSGNSGIADQILKEFQLVESKASKLSFLDEKTVRQQMNHIVKMINGNLKGIDFSQFTNGMLQALSKGSKGAEDFRKQLKHAHNIMNQISNAPGLSDIRKSMTELNPAQMDKVIKLYQKQQTLQAEYDATVAKGKEKAYAMEAKQLKSLARMKEITGNKKYQEAISDKNISTTAKMLQLDSTKGSVQTDVKEYSRLIAIYDILIEKRERLNKSTKITDTQELVETNKTLLALQEQISRKETALQQKYGVTTKLSSEVQLADFDEKTLKKHVQSSIDKYAQVSASKVATQLTNATNAFKATVDKEATKSLQKRTEAQTARSANIQKSIQKTSGAQDQSISSDIAIVDLQKVEQAAQQAEQAVSELTQELQGASTSSTFDVTEQALINIKDQFQEVTKYAVDYQTALSKLHDLDSILNERDFTLQEAQDYVGYGQRIEALGLTMPEDIEDTFYTYADEYKKIAAQVFNMTEAQLSEIERLKTNVQIDESVHTDSLTEEQINNQQQLQQELKQTKEAAEQTAQSLHTTQLDSDANTAVSNQQQLQQELAQTEQQAKETEQALQSIDNIHTESATVDTAIDKKNHSLVDERQTVTDVSSHEIADLTTLKSAVENVTQAVNEKTAAFEKEKSTVQEVVSSEIADLDKLSNKLGAVGKALAEAKENAKIVSEQTQTLDLNSTTQKTTETSTDTSTSQKSSKKDVSEVTKVTNALNRLIKTEIKYQELTAKQQANKITAKEAATLEKITIARKKDLDVINSTTKYTDLQIKKQLEWNQTVQDGQRVAQAFNNALANEKSATANKKQEKITDIINNADNKLKQSIGKFTINNQALTGSAQVVDRVQNKFEELNVTFRAGGMSIADYNRDIKTLTTGLDSAKDEADDLTQAMLKMKQEALSRGASEYNIKTDEDKGTVTAFYTDKNTKEIIQFTQAYNDMSGTISHHTKTNGKEMGAFSKALSGWKGKVGEVVRYLASFGGVYEIWNVFKQGVGIIKDLDDALTEMSKVSDESLSTLQAFQKESFVLADNVGGTGQIIQQSTADWQRLGESLAEAKKSAQASTVLFNVSEFDNIDSATDSLVAMSQAYSDMDKMDIIDKLNNIGNNYSIATDGIATALQKSASALKTANNDIDESIALITAGNAVVQDPDSVGAGIRTIALRIQGTAEAKAELQSMGEDVEDYVVQTSSKINETVKNFTAVASNDYKGVSVLDANGNYRSTYEILQDIADIYDEIVATDKQLGTNHMAGLLETLAGKNRANIAASILQNGDMLRSVYQDSQTSEGSALEENEKYMESISGHLDQLKNKWQEVWANTATRDSINMVIDLGKALLEVVDTIGLFPTAGIFGAIFGGLYNFEKTGPLLSQALARPKTWLQTNFIIKWGYYHKGYYMMA